jgi:hypothetical protein
MLRALTAIPLLMPVAATLLSLPYFCLPSVRSLSFWQKKVLKGLDTRSTYEAPLLGKAPTLARK